MFSKFSILQGSGCAQKKATQISPNPDTLCTALQLNHIAYLKFINYFHVPFNEITLPISVQLYNTDSNV
jgi:hypothetical protein